MNQAEPGAEGSLFSIATVSERTGIGIDTLRVWEKRYGKPVPVRLPSGHRRYTEAHVAWLARIADAVGLGHRPSRVLKCSEAELEALLAGDGEPCASPPQPSAWIGEALDLVRRFDGDAIRGMLQQRTEGRSIESLATGVIVPLLKEVGEAWEAGDLEIRHEHFLSEILEDFVRARRYQVAPPTGGPNFVLAGLSGERHRLGLQLAGLVLAQSGFQVHLLGPDTPVTQLVAAAQEVQAIGVGVSVSLATGSVSSQRQLLALRQELPDGVRLLAGGHGARRLRRPIPGVTYVPRLEDLATCLSEETPPIAAASRPGELPC